MFGNSEAAAADAEDDEGSGVLGLRKLRTEEEDELLWLCWRSDGSTFTPLNSMPPLKNGNWSSIFCYGELAVVDMLSSSSVS